MSLSRHCTVLAVALAITGATPGLSEPSPPIRVREKSMSPHIARCLIESEQPLIDDWLRTLPGSQAEARLISAAEPHLMRCFENERDISWQPEFNALGVRVRLIRALLQQQRTHLPAALPVTMSKRDWYADAASVATPQDAPTIMASAMGLCLVRTDWNDAVALIDSVDQNFERYGYWDSSADRREAAAANKPLNKFIPFVAGCIPAGAKLRIDRNRLRSIIEEATYHILKDSAA